MFGAVPAQCGDDVVTVADRLDQDDETGTVGHCLGGDDVAVQLGQGRERRPPSLGGVVGEGPRLGPDDDVAGPEHRLGQVRQGLACGVGGIGAEVAAVIPALGAGVVEGDAEVCRLLGAGAQRPDAPSPGAIERISS